MREHTKIIISIPVKAYNDSGADWVVWSPSLDVTPQRFPIKKFTMKESMKFFIDVFGKRLKKV
ncbi:MAG: hypothetical protein KZQ70_09955 [gamma proteobacterium symbiont of Lucinoma myriamae]|nr:hypothetical protein [gamma proteobacterium symbiont of Lucinoma myriamae]